MAGQAETIEDLNSLMRSMMKGALERMLDTETDVHLCFWDLTRFHSTAWNLIVSQTVFCFLSLDSQFANLLKRSGELSLG
jgi:hypothetical protein